MANPQQIPLLVNRAEQAHILVMLLTFADVITTIIAKNMGFPEANPYVLTLMNLFGFYGGLIVYFILIYYASYIFLTYYRRYGHLNSLIYLIVNTVGFCGLWSLVFSRFIPVFNNSSIILGINLIPPTLLRLDFFVVVGFLYGLILLLIAHV